MLLALFILWIGQIFEPFLFSDPFYSFYFINNYINERISRFFLSQKLLEEAIVAVFFLFQDFFQSENGFFKFIDIDFFGFGRFIEPFMDRSFYSGALSAKSVSRLHRILGRSARFSVGTPRNSRIFLRNLSIWENIIGFLPLIFIIILIFHSILDRLVETTP